MTNPRGRWPARPPTIPLLRVSDGTRTRDFLDHNQVLYQLSYTHHARAAEYRIVRSEGAGTGYFLPPASHWSQGTCQSPRPSQYSSAGPPLFCTM